MRLVHLSIKNFPLSSYVSARSLSTQYSGKAGRTPREPLELDASLRQLLHDIDGSLGKSDHRNFHEGAHAPQLQVYSETEATTPSEELDSLRDERKSPAAAFGSGRPRQLHLPVELEDSIRDLVNNSDKHQLRSDAKRLFLHPRASSDDKLYWKNVMPTHSSKKQERIMGKRDGMAFMSTVMPAQFAAIRAVLNAAKMKLEPDWMIEEVMDFGSKTGNGFWASRSIFGDLKRYQGLEHRTGFTAIAKTLSSDHTSTELKFEQSFEKRVQGKSSPSKVLALCAFTLSELKTEVERKQILRQLWDTGAEYIVVIDHGTKDGFKLVGDARQYLLRKGQKELDGSQNAEQQPNELSGAHVVAPCPHDSACPLHSLMMFQDGKKPTRLAKLSKMGPTSFCHFSQRVQRPDFVRLTKHANKSYEDVLYSYVVIRRGSRPTVDTSYFTKDSPDERSVAERMRIGAVGTEEAHTQLLKDSPNIGSQSSGVYHFEHPDQPLATPEMGPIRNEDIEGMRKESYTWPRVIYPPLKRSGHIILDSCTQDGNISRLTIPKSQGKQPFYDARKASWGDIFPHLPKNGFELRTKGVNTEGREEEDDFGDLVPGVYDFQIGEDGELKQVS
ncbi:37S ribosomal protein S22 [Tulasnella sp. 419]|nr:37S ribosomal protein S22 [Tulasnella sp. 419]